MGESDVACATSLVWIAGLVIGARYVASLQKTFVALSREREKPTLPEEQGRRWRCLRSEGYDSRRVLWNRQVGTLRVSWGQPRRAFPAKLHPMRSIHDPKPPFALRLRRS